MKNQQIVKIKLPSEVNVVIPAFSDIPIDITFEVIKKQGLKKIEDIIVDKILQEFVKIHEPYIQSEVERLLEEKKDEIKKIIQNKELKR